MGSLASPIPAPILDVQHASPDPGSVEDLTGNPPSHLLPLLMTSRGPQGLALGWSLASATAPVNQWCRIWDYSGMSGGAWSLELLKGGCEGEAAGAGDGGAPVPTQGINGGCRSALPTEASCHNDRCKSSPRHLVSFIFAFRSFWGAWHSGVRCDRRGLA